MGRSRSRSRSRERGGRDDHSGGPKGGESTAVLARNLPHDTQPEEVRTMFERYGPVSDVYLPRDYYTKRPKGFGFISFQNEADANEAIRQLDGRTFGGRQLTVVMAKEKRKSRDEMKVRDSRGDGGRGDGRDGYRGDRYRGERDSRGGGRGGGGGYRDRGRSPPPYSPRRGGGGGGGRYRSRSPPRYREERGGGGGGGSRYGREGGDTDRDRKPDRNERTPSPGGPW